MDDKKKRALIQELSVTKNFEASYSEQNRRWFVEKLIRGYEAAGLPDPQIEAQTRDAVTQSKTIVTAKRDFQLKLALHVNFPGTEQLSRPRRVEILYGLIAADPKFMEAANTAFFDFIAARRYRAVQRMILFVNSLGYFIYPPDDPGTCPAKPLFHVNMDAEPFWEPVLASEPIPIKLKPQPSGGTLKPLDAITKLWELHGDPCDANVFECATAMSCVLMDSLLEADDPGKLLNAVVARGATHLIITHPHKSRGLHFLWDEAPTRLFSKEGVRPEDLQIGDHVYIWNHPVYAELDPFGVWRGEHSILADFRDRNLKSGMRFSGHGFELATITRINVEFLKTVNTLLDRVYRLGSIFLEYMRSGGTSIPPAQVVGPNRVQTTLTYEGATQTVDVDLYFFDVDYEFNDYRNTPTKEKRHGFIVSYLPGGVSLLRDAARPTFGLHWDTDLTRAKQRNPLGGMPYFQRTEPPTTGGSAFDPLLWRVIYQNLESGKLGKLPLFKREKGRLSIQLLTPDDMPKEPFGRWKHILAPADPLPQGVTSREDPVVTRPTVILYSTPYEDFLKASGAIP